MEDRRSKQGDSPVPKESMELDDGLFLLQAELAPLDVWSQVVGPPQPATLPAPLQPCTEWQRSQFSPTMSRPRLRRLTGFGRQRSPAPVAVLLDVGEQLLVFLRRPGPLLQAHLLAAR